MGHLGHAVSSWFTWTMVGTRFQLGHEWPMVGMRFQVSHEWPMGLSHGSFVAY